MLILAAGLLACSTRSQTLPFSGGDASTEGDSSNDGTTIDAETCSEVAVRARVGRQPVDIIWVVDNSTSMEPAIRQVQSGINAFAASIGVRDLDYRVIMLSLRGEGLVGSRYGVCVPAPLAGDGDCGDGERFFQVEVDIKSTQPLEQLLGTLGQTEGYTEEAEIGSAPWRSLLRDGAAKSIVVVTDDNARTCNRPHPGGRCENSVSSSLRSAFDEEYLSNYPGGVNPFNPARSLPPGLLMEVWGGLFDGYTFSAIYGWGSESDIEATCEYSSGDFPPSSGPTYTALVQATRGVRAQICDGPSAWGPFFDAVARRVDQSSGLDCDIDIPAPPDGMTFDANQVNVDLVSSSDSVRIPRVRRMSDCDGNRAWYYDDDQNPQSVRLCPAACTNAQETLRADDQTQIRVQFGCDSILL